MATPRRNETGRLTLVGLGIAGIAIALAIASSWFLYTRTSKLLADNLRERLLSISITEAANLNPDDVAALQVEDDWKKPEWSRVVRSLKAAKDANKDIVFMYLFRRSAIDPAAMEFIADAESINPYANTDADPTNNVDANSDGIIEPDGADKLQWPGQPYMEAVDIPETQKAYSGPLTVAEPYQDSYGPVYTGYAPITNASGTVVAILGTDIRTGDFFTITQQTFYPFVLFIVFLVLTILFLTATLIFLWRKRTETLIEFDRQKNQFLSIATHDLKAPLTVIRNFTSLIIEGTYGTLPVQVTDGARQAFERATDMTRLVDAYLDVSRIEQGRMKYDFVPFDITKTVSDITESFRPTATTKGLDMMLQIPDRAVTLKGDATHLREALNLLIDNSIKYTPSGSISINMIVTSDKVRIIVADTGVGMSDDTIKNKLFKMFSTADDAKKTNPHSTGVGLYVVKAIIDAHKGRISAESAGPGKGSTFIVELPLQ